MKVARRGGTCGRRGLGHGIDFDVMFPHCRGLAMHTNRSRLAFVLAFMGSLATGHSGGSSIGRLIPTAAAVADFDGDGRPDLAVTYRSGDRGAVVVRPARADWQTPPALDLEVAPAFAVAGDVD